MKRIALISVLAIAINLSYAYDLEVNGIYYNYNTNDGTVSVTSGDIQYSGTLVSLNIC